MAADKTVDVNQAGKDAQELAAEVLDDAVERAVRNYHPPKSPEVLRHLEWFQDQKYGLMVHWGLYNQLGIKESWPLVDNEWSKWQFKPGTTDYKVTGPEVPWRTEKHADITKALFDAFRARGMGISLYYSRADFKCPLYWEEGYAEKDGTVRLPSYNPDEKPEKWRAFQEYVYTQLDELVSGYGKID